VYTEPHSLGLDPLIQSWMDTLPKCFKPSMKASLMTLFDTYLQPSITFLRRNLQEPVPTVDNQVRIVGLCFVVRAGAMCVYRTHVRTLRVAWGSVCGAFACFACGGMRGFVATVVWCGVLSFFCVPPFLVVWRLLAPSYVAWGSWVEKVSGANHAMMCLWRCVGAVCPLPYPDRCSWPGAS
jgi:hypothetical protein